ncbi:MAG: fatty acid desaturase [Pseudomonadota bacterium]
MTHSEFLRSLDRETRKQLTRTSNVRGLLHLAGHLGLIAIAIAWIVTGLPFWWVVPLPLGILLVFLFTLEHETVHGTPFASLWLNRLVGTLCGAVQCIPFTWFRYFHLAHHKHTNDPDNDPELEGGKPETPGQYLWHVSGIPLWRSLTAKLLRQASGSAKDVYLPASQERRVVLEARVHLLGYLGLLSLLVAGQTWVFWCWLLPLILGQPFLRLYLLAEHGRCPPVADMFENTRTTYTAAAVRFIAWNMPYHAEHHTFPAVPFWKLPQLNALIAQQLKSTSDGYTDFHKDYVGDLTRGR